MFDEDIQKMEVEFIFPHLLKQRAINLTSAVSSFNVDTVLFSLHGNIVFLFNWSAEISR